MTYLLGLRRCHRRLGRLSSYAFVSRDARLPTPSRRGAWRVGGAWFRCVVQERRSCVVVVRGWRVKLEDRGLPGASSGVETEVC